MKEKSGENLSYIFGLELLGFHELSEKVFKLEGTLERLHPTIAAWCIRNPILNFFKKSENNEQEIHEVSKEAKQNADTPSDKDEEPVILPFVTKQFKENEEEMKISFDTSRLNVIALAERAGVKAERLLESIKYEIDPTIDHSCPCVTVGHDGISKRTDLADVLSVAAKELNLSTWTIRDALNREMYYLKHEEDRDYNKLRENLRKMGLARSAV